MRLSIHNLHLDEKHINGGVRFDAESCGGGEPKQRSASTVRVIRRRQSGYGIAISRCALLL